MKVNENVCTSDGRDGPYGSNGIKGPDGRYGLCGFIAWRAKMGQMAVWLYGQDGLYGPSGAIQPFSVAMY